MNFIFSFFTFLLCCITFESVTAQELPAKKRILVGSPIRQDPKILQEFCDSLDRLEKTSYTFNYCFVDDNDNPKSSEILQIFAEQHPQQCLLLPPDVDPKNSHYFINEIQHMWTDDLVWKVAGFKNKIIEIAKNENYDYLFLIDSDLVLHPKTIEQLLCANKDIISNIFWTSWQPNTLEMPQVWLQDEYNFFEVVSKNQPMTHEDALEKTMNFFALLRKPGVYPVGGLGACTLISHHALVKGASFERIKNISMWGEDRHFCVRAMAIGIPLFVDTHYPAYHIYRITALPGVEKFKQDSDENYIFQQIPRPRLTLSMVVKNESSRYLKDALLAAREYITDAVIIDDASTDDIAALCQEILADIPLKLIVNEQSKCACETSLREQQWNETVKTNPDWILCLDADEIFETKMNGEIKAMIENPNIDAYYFRLYDFWDQDHYRQDNYWSAHFAYRPFLVRYKPSQQYSYQQSNQDCGRFPIEVLYYDHAQRSDLRLKHYGWVDEQYRIAQHQSYLSLDANARSRWKEQYDSLLDPNPILIKWEE